ncbi:oligosaccharide repeat unit polymerase [Providencia hangzhouensis]|uniref:oligosaccharide repeat unit polymerase n=1 Tax=Providencia TaxID=586 RepID=UPI0034DDB1C5
MNNNSQNTAFKSISSFTLYLYLFFNFACFFYFSITGFLGGDFRNQNIPADILLLSVSLLIIILTFYFYLRLIPTFIIRLKIKSLRDTNIILIDLIALLIISFGIYSAIKFKIGVLGLEKEDSFAPSAFRMLSALTQPIYFGIIYLFYRCNFKSRLYIIILFLYILLIFSSGQTGQLLLIFLLYLYNSYINKGKIKLKKIFLLTSLCIFIYPFFRLIKDIAILSYTKDTNITDEIKSVFSADIFEIYITYLFISLERFQIIANIQFLLSNWSDIYTQYNLSSDHFIQFFSDYWISTYIIKITGFDYIINEYISPQSFLAFYINGKNTWASHIGPIGYFVFFGVGGGLILFFSIILTCISFYISKIITSNNNIILLTWLFTLQLICHGWIFAYVAYIQALIIFFASLIILKIKNYLSNI